MAVSEQHQAAIIALKKALEELLSFEGKDLIRSSDLGKANFSELEDIVQGIIDLAKTLNGLQLSSLPVSTIQEMQAPITHLSSSLSAILSFQLQGDVNQNRNNLIGQVSQHWQNAINVVGPKLSLLQRDLRAEIMGKAALISATSELEAAKSSAVELGDSIAAELRETLDKVKGAAAEVGAGRHSSLFQKEADAYATAGRNWLTFTVLLCSSTLAYVFFLPWIAANLTWLDRPLPDNANLYATLHAIMPRATFLIILGFAIVWSARNYAASRHNEIVNRHRQNALNTFETFVSSTTDLGTKNAVLLQTTKSIFSPQDTAFSRSDGNAGPATSIFEFVKGSTGGKAEH